LIAFTKKKEHCFQQDFYFFKSCFSLALILYFTLCNSYSQTQDQLKIDSISNLLSKDEHKDKADLYYQLSELYTNIDSIKAKKYVIEGLDISERKNDSFSIAKGRFTLAGLYFDYNI